MASKTSIDNSRLDSLIFYHIYNLCNQRTCLPSKSTTRLHDYLQMWITGMKILQYINKVFHIIIFTGHKMASTKVYPFQLRKPFGKFFFNMLQSTLKYISPTLAMTVTMESFYVRRQFFRQFICRNTKSRTRCARII